MALILTRRIDETLVIGDEIVVTVFAVDGNQVKVGISAPGDIDVHREEVYERIQCEKHKSGLKTLLEKTGLQPAMTLFSHE